MSSVYICGCALNCERHLDAVFLNISKIIPLFDDYQILVAFDKSEDMTLRKLCDLKRSYNMEILVNPNPRTSIRTQNIANARNQILKYMRRPESPKRDYFIMIDMDDVSAGLMEIEVLKKYLVPEYRDIWDALSFHRDDYYDIWALSIPPYMFSCWHVPNGYAAVAKIKPFIKEILDSCEPNNLVECSSAFNGFGIYRSAAFDGVWYEWSIQKVCEIMTKEQIEGSLKAMEQPYARLRGDQDCEHRWFHMKAIADNNAKIRISPLKLFTTIST
jgi:hypothetical protein